MLSPNVILISHPVIQTKLTELRDVMTDHREFRALLDEIAGLMVYEVTRDWPTKPRKVMTPLEEMTGQDIHSMLHPQFPGVTTCDVSECRLYQGTHGDFIRREVEETFFRANGTSFPVEFQTSPILDDDLLRPTPE